jgi:hypothetical protein
MEAVLALLILQIRALAPPPTALQHAQTLAVELVFSQLL